MCLLYTLSPWHGRSWFFHALCSTVDLFTWLAGAGFLFAERLLWKHLCWMWCLAVITITTTITIVLLIMNTHTQECTRISIHIYIYRYINLKIYLYTFDHLHRCNQSTYIQHSFCFLHVTAQLDWQCGQARSGGILLCSCFQGLWPSSRMAY